MSLQKIHLRKLLQIMYAPDKKRVSLLREDIRNDINREISDDEGGGNFHVPFWADAKAHVAGRSDLINQTQFRIKKNPRRGRLYPRLQDGFLIWWNEKRRWKNEPFEQVLSSIKAQYPVPELDSVVKVDNTLAFKVGDRSERVIYPYFSEEPSLPDEGARVGLWLLGEALRPHRIENIRVLDVLRSKSFSTVDVPILGDEQRIFLSLYSGVIKQWEKLKEEY